MPTARLGTVFCSFTFCGPRTNFKIHDPNNAATTVEEEIARPASCSRLQYVFYFMYYISPIEFYINNCRDPQPVGGNAVNCQSVIPYKPFGAALSDSHIERRIINLGLSIVQAHCQLKEAQRRDKEVAGQRYISAAEVVAQIFQFSMY
jgi:hypothetical protein